MKHVFKKHENLITPFRGSGYPILKSTANFIEFSSFSEPYFTTKSIEKTNIPRRYKLLFTISRLCCSFRCGRFDRAIGSPHESRCARANSLSDLVFCFTAITVEPSRMIRIAAKCAQILVLPDAIVEDWRFTNITSVYNGRTLYAGGKSPRFNIFRTLKDEHIFDTFFFDCTACFCAIFTRSRRRKLNLCSTTKKKMENQAFFIKNDKVAQ